jgi:putative phosphoesterase
MRVAILSDIHGNLSALEAVAADIRFTTPDLVLHGGDLADGGSSPAAVVDLIRSLGWYGVLGNTDEMLFRPASLSAFALQHPNLVRLFEIVGEMAAFTREALGQERLFWLETLPLRFELESICLVHASPDDPWQAPTSAATEEELVSVFTPLNRPIAVYGHIHKPYVRHFTAITIANAGSVGLPYDGDSRASYLLIDNDEITIHRVEYDIEGERQRLLSSGLPYAEWVTRLLQTGSFQMP